MHIHRIKTDRTSSERYTSPTDTLHYHNYGSAQSSFSGDTKGHTHLFGDVATGPGMVVEGVSQRVLKAKEAAGTAMFDMTDSERGAFKILDQFINGSYDFTEDESQGSPR